MSVALPYLAILSCAILAGGIAAYDGSMGLACANVSLAILMACGAASAALRR